MAPTENERALLRSAILNSIPAEPSQYNEVEARFVYLPRSHVRALDPDAMLVEGIRGAGKSFWWYALRDNRLRAALYSQGNVDVNSLVVTAGFGLGSDPSWPEKDEIQSLLKAGHTPRLIWKSVVLNQVAKKEANLESLGWLDIVRRSANAPSEVANALRLANERLRSQNIRHLVIFDALDRTADEWNERQALLKGLLEVVLELRAFTSLRAKVFVRPDMLDPQVQSFPDASKVVASRVQLEWTREDLFALLFRYLGNGSDDEAARAFRDLEGKWTESPVSGWQVPEPLRSRMEAQRKVLVAMAGSWMGKTKEKGKTYEWIPNHLADGFGKVSPRSFLAAIRAAADMPEASGQTHALHWKGLQEGVRTASEYRVAEIKEDLPWAHEAMNQLVKLVVPCEQDKLLDAWKTGGLLRKLPNVQLRAPKRDKLEGILEELRSVGILKLLPDGRVNIPDVYRVGFGLRRKGGFVPR